MRYKSHKGWYKIVNQNKFVKPLDNYMESTIFKDGAFYIQYKSSLERIAFVYADLNPKIKKFSIEPFNIKYIKPLDNKEHRYFIDLFLEFITGEKFIVEIKTKAETVQPRKPSKITEKSMNRYKDEILTYITNRSKWEAAKVFAKENNMNFIILTEDQLK